jgi:hypothetical protein
MIRIANLAIGDRQKWPDYPGEKASPEISTSFRSAWEKLG